MGQAKLNYTKTNKYLYPAYQDFVVHAHDGDTTGTTYIYPYGWVTLVNFKYTLEIKVNDESVVILKAPKNENDNANFHIQKIFQDYLQTDITPYAVKGATKIPIHTIQDFQANLDTFINVELIVGQQYNWNSENGETTGVFYSNQTPVASNTQTAGVDTDFFVFNGVSQMENGENFNVELYELDGNGKFLTEYNSTDDTTTAQLETYNNKLRKSDYHVIGMFYGDKETFTSDVYQMRVVTYDASMSAVGTADVTNSFADSTIVQNGMTERKGVLWFGCGVQNLIDAGTFTLSDFNTVKYYAIVPRKSDGTVMGVGTWFEIQDEPCKGFETIRLGYVNTLGTWDYYNFTKRSTKSSTSNRTTFEANYGFDTDVAANGWDYIPNSGGTQVLNNTVTEEIEANTDFIGEDMANILKSLFVSSNVQMQLPNRTWVPVVVVEKEYIKQTKANDSVIQYVIGISKSHKYKVQRR